ncbi:MAG: hypothetical protein ACE5JP_16435 [Candidatus Bipolaricaulia bacterium]
MERSTLRELISERFRVEVLPDAQFQAAGPFRFASTEDFIYMDRMDVGSVAFEMSRYGISEKELDPSTITKEVLLPRMEVAFRQTGLDAKGQQFIGFQDEFVGTAQPRNLPPDFDPRRASKHVARTAVFQRVLDGVPVFGSELLIGLMPDGSIGRFRMHWPQIERSMVQEARELQDALRNERWTLPQIMRSNDIKILEIIAGIGHSGFADPGFRAGAVVRVLFRRVARDTPYPITSTAYKFFDVKGQEILFSIFPEIPGTSLEKKQLEEEGAVSIPWRLIAVLGLLLLFGFLL